MIYSLDIMVLSFLCAVHYSISTLYDDRHKYEQIKFDILPGHVLFVSTSDVTQNTIKVRNKKDCVLFCTDVPWCRSVNVKRTPESDGLYVCEMISTDKFTNQKDLKQDANFTHYSMKNPCEAKPCASKIECKVQGNRQSYTCKCPTGLTGKTCHEDVNECNTTLAQGCHKYAECINTHGSYYCSCKMGYSGNGRDVCIDITPLENSTILTSHGNASYFDDLNGFLTPVLQNSGTSRWVRCWHAASDGWDVTTTFHPQCDRKGPTVTIVRVGKYVFGGYTDASWHSRGTYSSSLKAFLFSLYTVNGYSPLKLTVKVSGRATFERAIFGISTFGPTFGSAYDLYISNQASSNQGSYTLPYSYEIPPGCSKQKFCSFFAGSNKFTPNDIEVFYEISS